MIVRKKPIEVEAVQWTGTQESLEEIKKLGSDREIVYHEMSESLFIRTLEGSMEAGIKDWIIKGVNGEIYPCKPDIFEKTYDVVDPEKPVICAYTDLDGEGTCDYTNEQCRFKKCKNCKNFVEEETVK